ncbi:MAG: hypothetical protein AAFQ07_21130, partial [Chloroflexota bacterium]
MSEKRKREDLRTKPPSVYRHMMSWGAVSGYFLAWAFVILLFRLLDSMTVTETLSSLITGFPIFSIVGALPGLVIGFFLGAFIESRLKKRTYRYGVDTISWRDVSLSLSEFEYIFLIAFVLMSIVGWLGLFIPSLIAGITATYAAHRYVQLLPTDANAP